MSAAKYSTVEKFLPLVDDFERALSAYPEQLAPLRKNLDKTLSVLGWNVLIPTQVPNLTLIYMKLFLSRMTKAMSKLLPRLCALAIPTTAP